MISKKKKMLYSLTIWIFILQRVTYSDNNFDTTSSPKPVKNQSLSCYECHFSKHWKKKACKDDIGKEYISIFCNFLQLNSNDLLYLGSLEICDKTEVVCVKGIDTIGALYVLVKSTNKVFN